MAAKKASKRKRETVGARDTSTGRFVEESELRLRPEGTVAVTREVVSPERVAILARLRELSTAADKEAAHCEADTLTREYLRLIGHGEVADALDAICVRRRTV